jgi:hypothetical protein
LPDRADRLVRYEKALLRAVFGRTLTTRLAELPESRRKAMSRVYVLLTREILRHDVIQPHGSEVKEKPEVQRLRLFRDQPRASPSVWSAQQGYLPYAVAFGLGPQWARHVQDVDCDWLRSVGSAGVGGMAAEPWLTSALSASWPAYGHHSGGGSHHGGYGGHGGGGHHGW